MKRYFTKTGFELTLIQGLGLGDGIPRGFSAGPKLDVASEMSAGFYGSQFDSATVSVRTIGYADIPVVSVRIKLDAKLLKKHGYFDGWVVDVSNWVYKSFGIGVACPSVSGLRERAKKGQKEIVFEYEISPSEAKTLGFGFKYGEVLVLKRAS